MSLSKSQKKVGLRKNKIETLETRMLEVEKKIDLICEWIERKYGNVLTSTEDDVPSRTLHTKPLNLTRALQPWVRVTKLPNSSVTLLSKPNSPPFNLCEYPKKGWTTLTTTCSSHLPLPNINTLIPQDIPSFVLPETVHLIDEQPQILYVDTTYDEAEELNCDSSTSTLCISTPVRLFANRKQTLQPQNVDREDEFDCFEKEDEIKIEVDYPSFSSPHSIQDEYDEEYILPCNECAPSPKRKTLALSKSNVLTKSRSKSNVFIAKPIQSTPNKSRGNRSKSKQSELTISSKFHLASKEKKPRAKAKKRTKKEQIYTCQVENCGRTFRKRLNFLNHESVHTGVKRVDLCGICGKSVVKGGLLAHRNTHSTQGKYRCDTCGKHFKQLQALKLHTAMHLGIKSQCNICGLLVTKNHLKRHMRYIHEKVRPYPCPECTNAFKSKGSLSYHLKTHENPKSKKRGLNKERENFSRKPSVKKIIGMPETECEAVSTSNLTLESIPGVEFDPRNDVSNAMSQYENQDITTCETSLITTTTDGTIFSSPPDWCNPIMPHIYDTLHADQSSL